MTTYDIGDFRWGFEMLEMMSGAFPESTDEWKREGLTGEYHPLGAGRRFIQGRAYSNGVYRQLVERPDGFWDDAVFIRTSTEITMLSSRIVNSNKAAHVAHHYGVTLLDACGQPVPFTELKESDPIYVPTIPQRASRPACSGKYTMSMFLDEMGDTVVHRVAAAIMVGLGEEYGQWQIGETVSLVQAYPHFKNSKGVEFWPFVLRSDGEIEIPFQWILKREPFTSDPQAVEQLGNAIRALVGWRALWRYTGRPRFSLALLEHSVDKFVAIIKTFKEVACV